MGKPNRKVVMANVVDLVEESAFTFRMPDEVITIKAADDRNAKQQKRAVGEVLKNAGSELAAIGQFDMGELLENLGKQFAGRGGGRKANTATADTATTEAAPVEVSIARKDAVKITASDIYNDGDIDSDLDDADSIEELANAGAVLDSVDLEDTGFEEMV